VHASLACVSTEVRIVTFRRCDKFRPIFLEDALEEFTHIHYPLELAGHTVDLSKCARSAWPHIYTYEFVAISRSCEGSIGKPSSDTSFWGGVGWGGGGGCFRRGYCKFFNTV